METGYSIMQADTCKDLVDAVQDTFKDGWELLGAPFLIPNVRKRAAPLWCQALYKQTSDCEACTPPIVVGGLIDYQIHLPNETT